MAEEKQVINWVTETELRTNTKLEDVLLLGNSDTLESQRIKISDLANVISVTAGSSYDPTPVENGGELPDTSGSAKWMIVGKGTYDQPSGGTLTTTEDVNIISTEGEDWSLNQEIPIVVEADGTIVDSDVEAVSGDTVYKYFDGIVVGNSPEIPFTLSAGQVVVGGGTNTSVNWISTGYINVEANTEYTIFGYGNQIAGSAFFVDNRVAFYNGSTLISWVGKLGDSSFTFTTPENTTRIKVNVGAGSNIGADIPNSPYWDEFKLRKGDGIPRVVGSKIMGDIETPQITGIESAIEDHTKDLQSIDLVMPKEYENAYTGNLANGALSTSGGTNSNEAYRRTSTTNGANMINYNSDYEYYYSGSLDSGTLASVCYYTETYSFISSEYNGSGVRDRVLLSPPPGTVYIAMCSLADNLPKIEFIKRRVIADNAYITLYVDASYSGGDSDGSSEKPFTTISNAISYKSTSDLRIFVKSGEYRETVNLNRANHTEIIGIGDVKVLGSNAITGWTKTAGRTNVYEAAFTATVPTPTFGSKKIFETWNPSKQVTASERHPYYRGLDYRLPYTEILEVADVATVDSTPSSYYADGTKIYVHTTNSDDPSSNGFSYENSVRSTTTQTGGLNMMNVVLKNISFFFSNQYGLRIVGKNVFRQNIAVFGARQDGFRDDVCLGESFYDEAGGNGNDGINGHWFSTISPSINLRADGYFMTYNYPWSHDNQGDGWSHHERSTVCLESPLTEQNGRCGIIPFAGCSTIVNNGISRNNALLGVSASGAPPDERIATTCVLNNCHIYNNDGGNIGSLNSSVLNAYNCLTENSNTSEFSASSNGIINAYNCRYTQSDPLKVKVTASGGVVNVENGTQLT